MKLLFGRLWASSKTTRPGVEPTEAVNEIVDDSALVGEATPTVDVDPTVSRSEKLIRLFLEKMPEQFVELERAFTQGLVAQARASVHKMKGSCLALAVPRMAQTAEAMQHLLDAGNLNEAGALLAQLREQYARVEKVLRAIPSP